MSGLSGKETQRGEQAQRIGLPIPNIFAIKRASEGTAPSLKSASDLNKDVQTTLLPILATANDVREVVQYLKKRADGVNISEVTQPLKKRIFFPPKIAAYEAWGIVSRNRSRIRLTSLGWEFARSLEPEAQSYRLLLKNTSVFRAALHWIERHGLEVVTEEDVADYWLTEFPAETGHAEMKRRRNSVVCFFHLCQAAELGTMTIGKRGQPARLRVLAAELQEFVQAETTCRQVAQTSRRSKTQVDSVSPPHQSRSLAVHRARVETPRGMRVSITCSEKGRVVDQIQETLNLAGVGSEIRVKSADGLTAAAGRGADEVKCRCDAGIIVITAQDVKRAEGGIGSLPDDILSEIGSAFVRYGCRLLLFWDEAIPLPNHLQGLRRCRFGNGTLTWDSGVELMKALSDFVADAATSETISSAEA